MIEELRKKAEELLRSDTVKSCLWVRRGKHTGKDKAGIYY